MHYDCEEYSKPEHTEDAYGCDTTPCGTCIKKRCHPVLCMRHDPGCKRWGHAPESLDEHGCPNGCARCLERHGEEDLFGEKEDFVVPFTDVEKRFEKIKDKKDKFIDKGIKGEKLKRKLNKVIDY